MKLSELIAKIDISKLEEYYGLDDLAAEFDIHDSLRWTDTGIEHFYISPSYCTDQIVGGSVLFINKVPVGLAFLSARKDTTRYSWFKDQYEYAKAHVESLVERSYNPTFTDLDADVGDGYKIGLSPNARCHLIKEAIYQGKLYKILDTYSDYSKIEKWHTINLEIDGKPTDVPLDDVTFPWLPY